MKKTRVPEGDARDAPATGVTTLVISQHEIVRRQLVAYLGRSPSLVVSGDVFSPEAIDQAHPDVLVLDLSQLCQEDVREAIDAAGRTGTRLIALASMRDPADERAVTGAGGLYRLKAAGADGLAEIVQDVASRPVSSTLPRAAARLPIGASTAGGRSQPTHAPNHTTRSRGDI